MSEPTPAELSDSQLLVALGEISQARRSPNASEAMKQLECSAAQLDILKVIHMRLLDNAHSKTNITIQSGLSNMLADNPDYSGKSWTILPDRTRLALVMRALRHAERSGLSLPCQFLDRVRVIASVLQYLLRLDLNRRRRNTQKVKLSQLFVYREL